MLDFAPSLVAALKFNTLVENAGAFNDVSIAPEYTRTGSI